MEDMLKSQGIKHLRRTKIILFVKVIVRVLERCMYAEFFRQYKQRRLSNPTYSSGGIFSTMMYPIDKKMPMDSLEQQILISPRKNQTYDKTALLSEIQKKYGGQQKVDQNPEKLSQEIKQFSRKRKSLSNLSNIGSGSLKNLRQLSYKEISRSQQKHYNIVSNQDRMFKNERIQRNYAEIEDSHRTRKPRRQLLSSAEIQPKQKRNFDPESYMGMSTVDKNTIVDRLKQIRHRAFYLNNADQIYL